MQKRIDVTEFSTSELFICSTHCYKLKRLFRLEKLSNNFLSLKEEIKNNFENGGLQRNTYERIQQQREHLRRDREAIKQHFKRVTC